MTAAPAAPGRPRFTRGAGNQAAAAALPHAEHRRRVLGIVDHRRDSGQAVATGRTVHPERRNLTARDDGRHLVRRHIPRDDDGQLLGESTGRPGQLAMSTKRL